MSKQFILFFQVRGIQHDGGTILGTSRGGFDVDKIINSIYCAGINQVYIIGGDGTHRAAEALFKESKKRSK